MDGKMSLDFGGCFKTMASKINLGEIARALHAITSSESICERGFSARKAIQRKTRSKMFPDLANALLRSRNKTFWNPKY